MVVTDTQAQPAEGPPRLDAGVVVRGVRRRFGQVEALAGLDLVAPYGQVTGLVGPNGSGKTTLLLILASLLTPDAGEVRVGGHDPLTETDAVRSVMGWVPDAFGVYDNLTGGEYLRFAAAAYGMKRQAAGARATELLALAHLEEFADSPVHVLSRGQKQRLGLVRALVHRPRVLLLDEPAAGLDPRSRVQLRGLLRHLAADGAAILVSSHVLGDLEEMADRAVFVDRGVTVGEHRVDELTPTVGRTWRLRALDMDALGAVLDSKGYPHTPVTHAGVEVSLDCDAAAATLLATLVRAKVAVVSCAPVTGSLEAAYLQLTEEQR